MLILVEISLPEVIIRLINLSIIDISFEASWQLRLESLKRARKQSLPIFRDEQRGGFPVQETPKQISSFDKIKAGTVLCSSAN